MKDKKSFVNQTQNFNKTKINKRLNQETDDLEKFKEFIKLERSVDPEIFLQNLEKLNTCRFYMAVLSGCFSGTLCLTGLYGLAFYVFVFIVFSVVLFLSLQFKKGYFFSNSMIFTHGLFTQIMVYVIFWVMFYNLVHIY